TTGSDTSRTRGEGVLERDPGMPASTWRLRSDAWEYLRFAVKRLTFNPSERDAIASDSELHRSLRALETIEMYWAGFGQRYVRQIGELLEQEHYDVALDRIGRVVNRIRGTTIPDEP